MDTQEIHENTFRDIFYDLYMEGKLVSPRGQLVKEIENFAFELPPYVRFQNFEARKMNLNYTKDEFLWYLRGNRFDLTICEKATIWKSIINKDGSLNSNYGQYIFGPTGQFDRVVDFLSHDKDSRRASIMILSSEHIRSETNDLPCTYSMNFRIRENKLNMSVGMRSQDACFGMGSDIPTFSFVHEMLFNALKDFYPDIEYGNYFHHVDSFHVYERHFKMLKEIAYEESPYTLIQCPKISGPDEVKFIRELNFDDVPNNFEFSRWLIKRK